MKLPPYKDHLCIWYHLCLHFPSPPKHCFHFNVKASFIIHSRLGINRPRHLGRAIGSYSAIFQVLKLIRNMHLWINLVVSPRAYYSMKITLWTWKFVNLHCSKIELTNNIYIYACLSGCRNGGCYQLSPNAGLTLSWGWCLITCMAVCWA